MHALGLTQQKGPTFGASPTEGAGRRSLITKISTYSGAAVLLHIAGESGKSSPSQGPRKRRYVRLLLFFLKLIALLQELNGTRKQAQTYSGVEMVGTGVHGIHPKVLEVGTTYHLYLLPIKKKK